MSRRIVVNVVKGLSRLLTKVFWRNYGATMLWMSLPFIFVVLAMTFALRVMEQPEWMRLVLAVMLALFIIFLSFWSSSSYMKLAWMTISSETDANSHRR